jgi:hypothetical protein
MSPGDVTRRCHPEMSPGDVTRRCHPEMSPGDVTRRCHPKMSPEDAINIRKIMPMRATLLIEVSTNGIKELLMYNRRLRLTIKNYKTFVVILQQADLR